MNAEPESLFRHATAWLQDRGLNLVGVVDAGEFDRCQPRGRRARDLEPGCDSILVAAMGGRDGWARLRAHLGPALETRHDGRDPIHDWSRRVARELLQSLDVSGSVVLPKDRRSLNFVQLGEMAGLGTTSPVIHQLLHPTYGPWISLQAAWLVEGRPFGAPEPDVTAAFQPCDGCSRPCARACPADVYDGPAPALDGCAERCLEGGCADGCDARRSCCVGAAHRYSREEETYRHAYALHELRRTRAPRWRRMIGDLLRFGRG